MEDHRKIPLEYTSFQDPIMLEVLKKLRYHKVENRKWCCCLSHIMTASK